MKSKIVSMSKCMELFQPGATVMVGGFMGVGTPERIVDALVEKGTDNMTLICNDAGLVDKGVGKLVVKKQFSKIIASHIGLNKEAGRQLTAGETQIELVPQGTLAERIRSKGAGLGGFLTPTGIGTLVEEGKQVIEVQGKNYLLEEPLGADVALLYGSIVDEGGNVYLNKTTRNFNPLMALAADVVVVEAQKIVAYGEIDPHLVMIPGNLVDYIVEGGGDCE